MQSVYTAAVHHLNTAACSLQCCFQCFARLVLKAVAPHWLPGLPELSKLQSAGASSEAATAGAQVFPRGMNA